MIALDTNVLVRLLTRDDEVQAQTAERVMRSDSLFLSRTVLLELVWVLSFTYRFDRQAIHGAVTRLLGLESLRVEDPETAYLALQWFGEGLDFADALHVASSRGADEFATFDRALATGAAGRNGAIPVRLL
jgi:predicted nucleic-acid-binding protein